MKYLANNRKSMPMGRYPAWAAELSQSVDILAEGNLCRAEFTIHVNLYGNGQMGYVAKRLTQDGGRVIIAAAIKVSVRGFDFADAAARLRARLDAVGAAEAVNEK